MTCSNIEKKITVNKNAPPSEAVLWKQRKNKDFPEQIKTEGVHYHQTCLTRNANGSSLSGSKRTLIIIIKPVKGSKSH